MESEIFKSKFVRVVYDDKTNIYFSRFLPETEYMTNKEWQELMIKLVKIIEKYKPLYIIDDNTDRLYAYPPDMQEWTLKLFVDCWNDIGLKKYVQILPENIIGKITSEQIEELANDEFNMSYKYNMVKDYDTAINWIKN